MSSSILTKFSFNNLISSLTLFNLSQGIQSAATDNVMDMTSKVMQMQLNHQGEESSFLDFSSSDSCFNIASSCSIIKDLVDKDRNGISEQEVE